jgi:hypothetical protein
MPGTSSLQITTSRAVTDGTALTFETLDESAAPLRIDPDRTTLLRVIGGIARLTLAGDERLLMPGDEAIVRAGEAHRLAGVAGEARVVMGFRSVPL